MTTRTVGIVVLLCFVLVTASGCRKKVPVAPPPPPAPVKEVPQPTPPPKAPGISQFTAEPSAIERGQATTLRWSTTHATEASIEPSVGTVQTNGSRRAFPSATTTYTLHVKGPGGTANATAMVSVAFPPPPLPPPPPPPKKTLSERLRLEVQDAYFDFDKSDIREDARAALSKDLDALKAIFNDFPGVAIMIEGHCDERGSAEYNMALGDRRANAAKGFLTQFGIPAERLRLVSYGKERPQCTESNEECWQKNRRVHFVPAQ